MPHVVYFTYLLFIECLYHLLIAVVVVVVFVVHRHRDSEGRGLALYIPQEMGLQQTFAEDVCFARDISFLGGQELSQRTHTQQPFHNSNTPLPLASRIGRPILRWVCLYSRVRRSALNLVADGRLVCDWRDLTVIFVSGKFLDISQKGPGWRRGAERGCMCLMRIMTYD